MKHKRIVNIKEPRLLFRVTRRLTESIELNKKAETMNTNKANTFISVGENASNLAKTL